MAVALGHLHHLAQPLLCQTQLQAHTNASLHARPLLTGITQHPPYQHPKVGSCILQDLHAAMTY